jgi:hypothetical protein
MHYLLAGTEDFTMDDRALIRSFEGFHNKRFLAFTGLALLAFGIVLIGLIAGIRRNHLDVARSADAMTQPAAAQPRAPTPPPATPLR